MPEIVIKEILNDSSVKRGLSESADGFRRWQREAQRIFEEVQSPAERHEAALARVQAAYEKGGLSAESYGRKVANQSAGYAEDILSLRDWGREAARVFEETRTASERYQASLARLQSIHSRGLIGDDTYQRKRTSLQRQFDADSRAESMVPIRQAVAASGLPGASLLAGVMGPVGIVTAAVAAMGAFGRAVKSAGDEMRAMGVEADKIGISLKSYATFQTLGKDVGVGIGSIGADMQRMSKQIGVAMKPGDAGKGVREAFRELGLDEVAMAGRSVEQNFQDIGTAIGGISNKFERARLETEIFGRSATDLDLLFRKMASGGMKDAAAWTPSEATTERLRAQGVAWDYIGKAVGLAWTNVKAYALESAGGPLTSLAGTFGMDKWVSSKLGTDKTAAAEEQKRAKADALRQRAADERAARFEDVQKKIAPIEESVKPKHDDLTVVREQQAAMRKLVEESRAALGSVTQFDAKTKQITPEFLRAGDALAEQEKTLQRLVELEGKVVEKERERVKLKADKAREELKERNDATIKAIEQPLRDEIKRLSYPDTREGRVQRMFDEEAATGRRPDRDTLERLEDNATQLRTKRTEEEAAKRRLDSAKAEATAIESDNARRKAGLTEDEWKVAEAKKAGVPSDVVDRMARATAESEARDIVERRAKGTTASAASKGSSEAYDLIARASQASQMSPKDKENAIAKEQKDLLKKIEDVLKKILGATAGVHPAPA